MTHPGLPKDLCVPPVVSLHLPVTSQSHSLTSQSPCGHLLVISDHPLVSQLSPRSHLVILVQVTCQLTLVFTCCSVSASFLLHPQNFSLISLCDLFDPHQCTMTPFISSVPTFLILGVCAFPQRPSEVFNNPHQMCAHVLSHNVTPVSERNTNSFLFLICQFFC
jgi:hypothetical protein